MDVEDVLQETFLGAWRGAAGYRPDGTAGGWLWGIARRQAALFLRRRGPGELVLPAVVEADLGGVGDPTEAVLSRLDLEKAVAALGPPGGRDRETWQLLCVEDRSVAEVAALMGVPEGTVKSRAHRARRLLRAALGDRRALELFSRHAPWLATRLRVVLPAVDVEDVLQETFLGVWRGAACYRPDGTAGGWLWGIARRQAALFLRRRGPGELVLPAVVEADMGGVGDPTEAVLSRLDLENAVAALGPPGGPDRETWQLLCVEDRSVAEVAALMGVPEGTVKSRAHRARRTLREALGDRLAVEGDS